MPHAARVVHINTTEVGVTEWRLEPGASTRRQRHHCDVVLVPLTRGRLRLVGPHGHSLVEIMPGASVLSTACRDREAINDGSAPVAFVEVELRNTTRRLISA
jgi:hypothetical protein